MRGYNKLSNDLIFIVDEATTAKDPVELEIELLANLQEGWDYGEGLPPSPETISRAIEIYRIGKVYSLAVEVVPIGDGEIIISFSRGDTFIDIVIAADGTYRLSVEIGIGAEYDIGEKINNASIDRIEDKLKMLAGFDRWKLCESSESEYSVGKNNDFFESAFEIIGEQFPWWMAYASP